MTTPDEKSEEHQHGCDSSLCEHECEPNVMVIHPIDVETFHLEPPISSSCCGVMVLEKKSEYNQSH